MWFKKENKKYDEDIIDVEIDEEDEIYDNNEYVEGGINKNRKSTSKKTPFEEGMKDFEDAMNQLGETIAKGINKAKVWMNNNKNDNVTNRLVKILPFMD